MLRGGAGVRRYGCYKEEEGNGELAIVGRRNCILLRPKERWWHGGYGKN